MKREDIRITRTKNELRRGLIELLHTESFEKITVREICAYTHINKMTFYKHYDDKYDLLDDCVRNEAENLAKEVMISDSLDVENTDRVFAHYLVAFIDVALRHKEEILSVNKSANSLGSEVISSTVSSVVDAVFSEAEKYRRLRYGKRVSVDFFAGGFNSVVLRILHEGGYDRNAFEKAAQEIFNFFFLPLQG